MAFLSCRHHRLSRSQITTKHFVDSCRGSLQGALRCWYTWSLSRPACASVAARYLSLTLQHASLRKGPASAASLLFSSQARNEVMDVWGHFLTCTQNVLHTVVLIGSVPDTLGCTTSETIATLQLCELQGQSASFKRFWSRWFVVQSERAVACLSGRPGGHWPS